MANLKSAITQINQISLHSAQKIYQKLDFNLQQIIQNISQIFTVNYLKWKIIKAKEIFERAKETPIWLGWTELENLQKKYPFTPRFKYTEKNITQRGISRAIKILKLIRSEKRQINNFLDLGCGFGMTCAVLQKMGKKTTGIDIVEVFDKRASKSGATFFKMDVADLKFEDESFDFVFSHDAFQYFSQPEKVLQEAIRVVKKNGYIYFSFGPLYMSPHGRHAYRAITIPYCHFLFPNELIEKFIKVKRLKPLADVTYNKWSLENFRKLWEDYSHQIKKIKYREYLDPAHLNLVIKYPSCFKSKTDFFENLIVSSISVLFEKIRN